MSRAAERARDLMTRHPAAWLAAQGDGYALRIGPDRRSRVALTLDEGDFRSLIDRPGLRTRLEGGWTARPVPSRNTSLAPGRPGVIDGERLVTTDDGRMTRLAANLGESPIAWLARRTDAAGQPWLSPAQAAAGERLRLDAEQAQAGPSLTMRWDALPRSGGGSAARVEPGDHALTAARRVEQALSAVGAEHRAILNRICLQGDSLKLAESGLGLRRRHGKTLLKQALQALAAHYRIG